MKLLEFIFWLMFACYGYIVLTFVLFLGGGREVLESKKDDFLYDFIQIEFLVLTNTLLFASSLQWSLDGGSAKTRIKKLKLSAFLLSVMVIVITTGFVIGAKGDLYSRGFVLAFFAVMSPLVLAMSCCYLRSGRLNSEGCSEMTYQSLRFEHVYSLLVALILFAVWNGLCFLP